MEEEEAAVENEDEEEGAAEEEGEAAEEEEPVFCWVCLSIVLSIRWNVGASDVFYFRADPL